MGLAVQKMTVAWSFVQELGLKPTQTSSLAAVALFLYPLLLLISLAFKPRPSEGRLLVIGLWVSASNCFVADTLLWYNLVLGVWGGLSGLVQHGFGLSKGDIVHLHSHAQAKLRE